MAVVKRLSSGAVTELARGTKGRSSPRAHPHTASTGRAKMSWTGSATGSSKASDEAMQERLLLNCCEIVEVGLPTCLECQCCEDGWVRAMSAIIGQ